MNLIQFIGTIAIYRINTLENLVMTFNPLKTRVDLITIALNNSHPNQSVVHYSAFDLDISTSFGWTGFISPNDVNGSLDGPMSVF